MSAYIRARECIVFCGTNRAPGIVDPCGSGRYSPRPMATRKISYREAGVDIDAGDEFAAGIGGLAARTQRPEVLAGIGGFAGLFKPNLAGMSEPVLVSGTDGVGTKLLVALKAGKHDTIGIDLVAMCANDVLTVGAEPLFFLDYYATGKLDAEVGRAVLAGIVRGCELAGCALLGGETAEMPGMYPAGKYDLAGFCVGMVDRPNLLDGSRIAPGDALIGLASSGLHSNGLSLVRHVLFERENLEMDDALATQLLEPTRIYVKPVLQCLREFTVHGMSHITGGGIAGNLTRVLPKGCHATLDRSCWPEPAIFGRLRGYGVPDEEMDKAFNLGLGMVIAVPKEQATDAIAQLQAAGETAMLVGRDRHGQRGTTIR